MIIIVDGGYSMQRNGKWIEVLKDDVVLERFDTWLAALLFIDIVTDPETEQSTNKDRNNEPVPQQS